MSNNWVLPPFLYRNGGDAYDKKRFFDSFFTHNYHTSNNILLVVYRKVPNSAMN